MQLLRILRNAFQPAIIVKRQSVCPACGEKFGCGATLRGCWCAEIRLSEAARAALRERYTDCLCRECLRRYADTNTGART